MRPYAAAILLLLSACSETGGVTFAPEADAEVDAKPVVDAPTLDASPDVALDASLDARADVASDARADTATDVPLFVDSGSSTPVCRACTGQVDCGADGVCVQVATGSRACLPRCNPDVPVCPGRLRCVRDVALSDVAVCAPVGGTCCIDGDGDGYGVGVGCRGPDCNDADPMRNVSGEETCNNADDDCDGMVDEGLSRACSTACGAGTERCAAGTWTGCTARTPAPEVCGNGMDDDCDGMTDEGCGTTTVPLCAAGPVVEAADGDYVILANYDGGRLTIDVDRPITAIGIIAYEPLEVMITGASLSSLRRIHIVGYNSMRAVVSGVPDSIVERAGMPMATLADPAGYGHMDCASTCRPGADPGGCNTLAQVLDYFRVTLGPRRAWWHMQYGTFTGTTWRVSVGGCCV
ncbi:MAG: putative metal-binding motif-containing protein [Polyangiales bacterium]